MEPPSSVEDERGVDIVPDRSDDIIESKRAVNRPKDLAAFPLLESLRDESGG